MYRRISRASIKATTSALIDYNQSMAAHDMLMNSTHILMGVSPPVQACLEYAATPRRHTRCATLARCVNALA